MIRDPYLHGSTAKASAERNVSQALSTKFLQTQKGVLVAGSGSTLTPNSPRAYLFPALHQETITAQNPEP